MCEITCQNFEEKYSDIINDVSNSDFIAVDCEFSGLWKNEEENGPSLFDEPQERYIKMRRGLEDFVSLQLGISLFTHKGGNLYVASTYVFYLFPRTYPYCSQFFTCDARSIRFLSQQQFDFNKVFRSGLTFVSTAMEKQVKKDINDGTLMARIKSDLSDDERHVIQSMCTAITTWIAEAKIGDIKSFDLSGVESFTRYIMRDRIESQFSVITSYDENHILKIEKGARVDVSEERKRELYSLAIGFTQLLKEIISMKKPLVGHNMFTDLLMIYKMFISPLPPDYDGFKREITNIFPVVYDTKHLSIELRKMIGRKYLDTSNILSNLYKFFENEDCKFMMPDMPNVQFAHPAESPRKNYHDSGFDSYCTGSVFLKLAHMFSMWDVDAKKFINFPLGHNPARYFNVLTPVKNRIHVTRGKIGHCFLNGPDPPSERPSLLLVKLKEGVVDILKISDSIAKYDAADIRLINSSQFVVASTNQVTAKLIRKYFSRNKNYIISPYNPKSTRGVTNRLVAFSVLGLAGMFSFFYCKKIWDKVLST